MFASNVDCFFRRSGWQERQIFEIHGNVQRWQCSLPCARSMQSNTPVWELPSSRRFHVDLDTMKAPRFPAQADESQSQPQKQEHTQDAGGRSARVTDDSSPEVWASEGEAASRDEIASHRSSFARPGSGGSGSGGSSSSGRDSAEVEQCDECNDATEEDATAAVVDASDVGEMPATRSTSTACQPSATVAAAQPRAGEQPSATVKGRSNFVHCPHCGRLARPCILMFEDNAWLGDDVPGPLGPGHSQPREYRAWETAVKSELKRDRRKRLVILEVGCGLRVPTVRRHSEKLLKATGKYGTRLIRINLDYPEPRKSDQANAIISLRDTCLGALQKIDAFLGEALARHGVRRGIHPMSTAPGALTPRSTLVDRLLNTVTSNASEGSTTLNEPNATSPQPAPAPAKSDKQEMHEEHQPEQRDRQQKMSPPAPPLADLTLEKKSQPQRNATPQSEQHLTMAGSQASVALDDDCGEAAKAAEKGVSTHPSSDTSEKESNVTLQTSEDAFAKTKAEFFSAYEKWKSGRSGASEFAGQNPEGGGERAAFGHRRE